MKFKYLKGSEADFDGAPKWATHKIINPNRGLLKSFGSNKLYWWYAESDKDSIAYYQTGDDVSSKHLSFSVHRTGFEIIAQREPIAEPEKLGHGLDCEECKPKAKGGPILAGKQYSLGDNYCDEIFIRNKTYLPISTDATPKNTDEDLKILLNIMNNDVGISQMLKDANARFNRSVRDSHCTYKETPELPYPARKSAYDSLKINGAEKLMSEKTTDKSVLTVTITAEDMRPTMQKLIDDFTSQPIELSLQIVNGRPVISDQFGRVLENQITGVEFGINSKLPPQVTISVKFKEIK